MDPITDEELAELERGHERMEAPFGTPDFCRRCQHYWPCPTARLIAALRASREEVERLKGYDHAAFFPTLVVPAAGVTITGPLSEPLLLVPVRPPER